MAQMAQKLDPINEFREDHRFVRDSVLDIASALEEKDVERAREILGRINVSIGPHFRYEEEYLYPALRNFLGDYVDDLLGEHDGAIATARGCAALLSKNTLTDEEAQTAKKQAMTLLIHVSNCDGLAILSERFDKKELDNLGDRLSDMRKKGIPLLEWADTIRQARA